MLNVNKINLLREQRKVTQSQLAQKIGISVVGLQQALKKGDFKISLLLRIADYFKVPVSYFFDELALMDAPVSGVTQVANGNRQSMVVQTAGEERCRRELEEARKKIIELQDEIIRLQKAKNE